MGTRPEDAGCDSGLSGCVPATEERSLNKQAKGMAAAKEGKEGKSRRLLKRAGKLMKKASRDSKDPYSDKVYTINKGFIGEKRGERILKKAEKKGDVSKFKNIVVQEYANKIKIKANRYSVLKCYTDTGYYMIIEKSNSDKYYIVEEYMETQPQSNC